MPQVFANLHKGRRKLRVEKPIAKQNEDSPEDESSVIMLRLQNNKRYAHTAGCSYQLRFASIQEDDTRLPHCLCENIRQKSPSDDHKAIVIVEHDLNEHILCILDVDKQKQCKLDLVIRAGEQVAFKVIGKFPVLLMGVAID